jgi:hypothetical protein
LHGSRLDLEGRSPEIQTHVRRRPEIFVTDTPLHFTKRELQRLFFEPKLWAGLSAAAVVLGIIGPFTTYDELRLPGRLAYWAVVTVSTYFTAFGTVFLLVRLFYPREYPGPVAFAAAGAVAGVPVALLVAAINAIVFGTEEGFEFLVLLPYCVAIAAIVSTVVMVFSAEWVRRDAPQPDAAGPSAAPRPRILDRIPVGQRGRLSHMSMQDHYVDIRTDRGGSLVLMRLADAIAETDGVEGLQIHRSHWVAKNAVERVVRKNGRLFLKLRDGTLLPVSRSYVAAVRAAGLG